MSNTILELSCIDNELSEQANDMFRDIEKELIRVIIEAQAQNEIDSGRDPKALARYLIIGIHGIRVYSKGNSDISYLQPMVDEILNHLRVTKH